MSEKFKKICLLKGGDSHEREVSLESAKAEIDKMTEESEKRVAREEGWKDGLEEGRKEGWKEGLEEGRKESKVIVQNLLSKKYSKAEIHELTGLSVEKIEEYAC